MIENDSSLELEPLPGEQFQCGISLPCFSLRVKFRDDLTLARTVMGYLPVNMSPQ